MRKIKKTKIVPNTINVGGGFPSIYPDLNPEPLINYMEEIKKELSNLKLNKLPEIIELKNHPWFIGVQFHPEFKSRPLAPHPLFSSFIQASKNHK